ncbi:hypothetical protein MKZ15_05680 [Paenibacillus sp. FSL R7-0216]|uniref:hypothetical protein n=1 Tax=Paenibacillus sp. FSL R7-0216 TaxID=2921677 RepID=UPI0030DB8166
MEDLISQLIDALAVKTGRSRQEVTCVFRSCITTNPDNPEGPGSIELNDVEKALEMEPGFFRRAVGRA